MSVSVSQQPTHNRGFLRSNGVEVSVFAMMAGLGVAMFLALTILGGDPPAEPTNNDNTTQWQEQLNPPVIEEQPSIGGSVEVPAPQS